MHVTTSTTRTDTTQYIEIRAAGGRYAVEMNRVGQLLRWEGAVEIPRSSEAVRGAINVRGQIVPVVELVRALGAGAVDYGRRGVVILLSEGSRIVGLLVEAVSDVLELGEEDERLPPSGVVEEDEPIAALLRVGQDTVFVVDVAKILTRWLPSPTSSGQVSS